MRILLLAAGALALSIGTSSLAQGNGNRGGGGGGGKPERAQQGGGHGGGQGRGARAERPNRGGGEQRADRGQGGGQGQMRQAERRGPDREARGNGRGRDVAERAGDDRRRGRGNGRDRVEDRGRERLAQPGRGAERRAARLTERRPAQVRDASDIARLRFEPDSRSVRGCPPGLAKKYNGCMPPGQIRQQSLAQNWYGNLWTYPDAEDYLYDDGYLVRLGDNGSIASYLPLLGGALSSGNPWPDQYQASDVPDYHLDYFGLGDTYDYRYADGAIYGVDPTTQMIQQVAALVTGDQWSLGQQMPDGYDIYNVPNQYRDQYQDSQEAMYRYSDGYVYQVDPTTQLVQAAIQLIT